MDNTFTHKVLMCMLAGLGAACLLWTFRHFVQEAFYASGEGWKESMHGSTAENRKP
jgi:hypothetical protein